MSPEVVFALSHTLVVLTKLVCFILGYLIIRLGYKLIAAGMKGEFKFTANLGGFKADLVSVSPGLLFVILGVFLIGYAIYEKASFYVTGETFGETHKPNIQLPKESPFQRDRIK